MTCRYKKIFLRDLKCPDAVVKELAVFLQHRLYRFPKDTHHRLIEYHGVVNFGTFRQ